MSVTVFLYIGFSLLKMATHRVDIWNYNPPALRVVGLLLYKKSPFRYNRVVQATTITRGKVILMANKANSLAHTKL